MSGGRGVRGERKCLVGVHDSFLSVPHIENKKNSKLLNSNKISITIIKSVSSAFSYTHFLS